MTVRVNVKNVSKKFKIYPKPIYRLIELFSGGLLMKHTDKWVLSDISFTVSAGESVAIVGRNGSGKSTLLSIIVGSRAPTTGETQVHGRVSALLELGMGFDPEFTGRQNAVMGLQILGVDNSKMQECLTWIENFAELGEYFDQSLRTYSSGMHVRLGFSVATAIQPDLLIVDEALAVGDAYFQHKSMARIRYLKERGTSLLFVSHDAASVKALCDRAILIDSGRVLMDDAPVPVMDYYNALIAEQQQSQPIQQLENQTRSGSGLVRIEEVSMINEQNEVREDFVVAERVRLSCRLRLAEEMPLPTVGFSIRDRFGNEVFGTNTYYLGSEERSTPGHPGLMQVEFLVPLNLGVGSYSLTIAAHTQDTHLEENFDWWDQALIFHVRAGAESHFQGSNYLKVEAKYSQP
jgi:lipopolysaccharide transport system ATP-binding protein